MPTERVVVLGALVVVVAAGSAFAAASLEVDLGAGPLCVGDRLPVRVLARGGGEGLWGELSVAVADDGPWAVLDGPRAVDGARPPVWELVLAPLEVGEIPLPEMSCGLRGTDGVQQVQLADPPAVEVASVLPPGEEEVEPAPMADPLGVSGFAWEWVLPAVLGVLPLAVLAGWLWRRRTASPDGGLRRPRSPREELAQVLAEIRHRLDRDPPEVICDRLATGIRAYLEHRSGEPALEMTSFELRALGRRAGWPEAVRRDLQRVLDVADGVRFGRRQVPRSELAAAVDRAATIGDDFEAFVEAEQAADREGAA